MKDPVAQHKLLILSMKTYRDATALVAQLVKTFSTFHGTHYIITLFSAAWLWCLTYAH